MSSAGSPPTPNPWPPYATYRDCSDGVCSIYCPQWCYIFPPPPPPFSFFDDDDDGGTDFSPLLIALIGILASAFLLVSYYTVISKFCKRRRGGRGGSDDAAADADADADATIHEIDGARRPGGLEESLIKSIKVYRYRKQDGFVDCTDCSVCLSEFEEEESLRLLPKCNHAFHAPCIDTWLRSHSNCPLCRANITAAEPNHRERQAPNSNHERNRNHHSRGEVSLSVVSALEYRARGDDVVLVVQDPDSGVRDEPVVAVEGEVPKSPIRRSISLNSNLEHGGPPSIADILRETDDGEDDEESATGGGSSEEAEPGKASPRNGVPSFLIRSSMAMKRSVSTGRFIFTRQCDGGRDSAPPPDWKPNF